MNRALRLLNDRFLSDGPFFVVLHVTARCNAKCQFCFNWDNVSSWRERDELSLDEIERLSRSIGPFYQLTIGGGEPFLRKDLADIIGLFHRNCEVPGVTIPTNGMLPQRIAETLDRALSENPELHIRLGLSIPEIGDELADVYQIKDAFRKHRETFQVLDKLRHQYSNLTVSAGVVCNKYNTGRVKEILDYIARDLPGVKPQLAMVRGKPRLEDAKDVLLADVRDVYAYYRKLFPNRDNRPLGGIISTLGEMVNELTLEIVEKDKEFLPCRSGRKMIVVYDNGDVFPCEYLDRKIGNIREYDYDLRAVMRSQRAQEVVDEIAATRCHCTWECANYTNIVFSPKHMVKLGARHAARVFS
jgi:MoaA/NifB/PqqE/SkfB family radical SAM enzyme